MTIQKKQVRVVALSIVEQTSNRSHEHQTNGSQEHGIFHWTSIFPDFDSHGPQPTDPVINLRGSEVQWDFVEHLRASNVNPRQSETRKVWSSGAQIRPAIYKAASSCRPSSHQTAQKPFTRSRDKHIRQSTNHNLCTASVQPILTRWLFNRPCKLQHHNCVLTKLLNKTNPQLFIFFKKEVWDVSD